jgi:hypothetical protein
VKSKGEEVKKMEGTFLCVPPGRSTVLYRQLKKTLSAFLSTVLGLPLR